MARMNLGGPMLDGSKAQDFWVEELDFVCASGAELSESSSLFKWGILGKLCLTKTCLVMLPYEGVALEVVKQLSARLRKMILGPHADMAEALEKLGLYPKGPKVLEKVLVWPLAKIENDAQSKELSFLGVRGGAQLIIEAAGERYYFNMAGKGHEPVGFASAQEFMNRINRLRPK